MTDYSGDERELPNVSPNGLCPFCGMETYEEEKFVQLGDEWCHEVTQICPSCGWESLKMYDCG